MLKDWSPPHRWCLSARAVFWLAVFGAAFSEPVRALAGNLSAMFHAELLTVPAWTYARRGALSGRRALLPDPHLDKR